MDKQQDQLILMCPPWVRNVHGSDRCFAVCRHQRWDIFALTMPSQSWDYVSIAS